MLPKLVSGHLASPAQPATVNMAVLDHGWTAIGLDAAEIDYAAKRERSAVPCQVMYGQAIGQFRTNVATGGEIEAGHADIAVLHPREMVHHDLHGPLVSPPG
jgi:hypothetical protein